MGRTIRRENPVNRWGIRILGLLIIIAFFLLMLNLQKQLVTLQKERQGTTTSTISTSTH